jgi:hypothetical protein
MLTLSACSSIAIEPEIDEAIAEPCKPLPDVQISVGEDIRLAWLKSRAIDVKTHDECVSKHKALLDSVR